MRRSSSVVYTGVPVGPSPLLAEGNYNPELALTNFGSKPATATIVAATTIGGTPKKQTVASLSCSRQVRPKTLRLDRLPDSPDLRTSIVVESSAPVGDLVTKLVSRGTGRLPAVEMLEREGVDGDPKERWFNVRFGNGEKPWMKRYKLASMETLVLSVNDLIARGEKDDDGKKLSIKATDGEVGWQADSTLVGGRIFAVGFSRNGEKLSCANFYSECDLRLSPDNLALGWGGTGIITATPDWQINLLCPDRSCACHRQAYANLGLSDNWWSENTENTGIAQVVSGSAAPGSLWFFGNGNSVPGYSTQAIVTSNGASGGTFDWSISSGLGAVSFANDSSSTTTSSNTVTIYSRGFSTTLNDVTISLTWTPSGQNALAPSTARTYVDSPYKLTQVGFIPPVAVDDCTARVPGSAGWWSRYTYAMVSFFDQAVSGASFNENFTNEQDFQPNNWTFTPNGSPGASGINTFSDNYCFANQIAARPPSLPPSNPLGNNLVDSATQFYNVGSAIVGSGVPVQIHTFQRYQDHPSVVNKQSPVR